MEILLLLFIFALFALPTLIMSRSHRKRVEEAKQLQSSIEPGDKIISVSGFHGTVVAGNEETVDLEIAPGVVVTMERVGVYKRVEEPATPIVDEEVEQ
ncbi:preprotein translocase subunit YajC [Corynebacterium tuscaniense]|nr:preprotein translocase subunit YajC [Corynebacterium tuscaniense]